MQAQKDSIYTLEEVVVSGYKLKKYSKGYKVNVISDSLIEKNNESLTDVLRFNSQIYFKEYGNGMISSASFRGTTASQTAVIWNGININSQLNGQTDFNTVSINNFKEIDIRSGGGSVLFGTGAIGGSIHLNNAIEFKKYQNFKIQLAKGSYNSNFIDVQTTHSNTNSFINFGINYLGANNDYPFLNSNLKNDNGEYFKYGFSGNFGVKINKKNWFKVYSNLTLNDRNTARSLNAPSKAKLKYNTIRNLIEWNSFLDKKQVITSRLAYLSEEYIYVENRFNPDNFSINKASTFIANIDYQYKISDKIDINGLVNYESTTGSGDDLQNKSRNTISFIGVLNHTVSNVFSYNAQLRKEFSFTYKNSLLYSFGTEFKVRDFYSILFNTSKNFRAPTLNDLYWGVVGNPNLKPENSYQFEIGNVFQLKKLKINFNGFYIDNKDLIQWKPGESGVWEPYNISKSVNYGAEISLSFNKKRGEHQFNLLSNYALTFAKDTEKKTDLIYVPRHRINFSLNYKINKFSAYYQQLINGKRKVNEGSLEAFSVSNIGVDYQLKQTKVQFTINNIFNREYQSYEYYPMPPRNYQIKLKLNI
ncbi:TonB-dependent receptor plug domain-containing protein [Tenacibaculum adriaticum]|uniref:TonB-dependent receptor plug domain-containing protein n=1 Tax=Tenacibaculum adriaticum TaxID=413713 RepID=UPI00147829E4|nr:TonB-dependent receptor [Tenacibaculum adriaticum]